MWLHLELQMIAELNNSHACDLTNSWNIGDRIRHVDVLMFFLQDLKKEGLVTFKHVPGADNEANIFTINVNVALLHWHSSKLY
jgi:histidinol phosphatase-like enzyme